jgi:tetratricopeptide (TPR) repeat protein
VCRPVAALAIVIAWFACNRGTQHQRDGARRAEGGASVDRNVRSARQALDDRRFREARELARDVTRGDPARWEGWALLGDAEREIGNYEGAEGAYRRLLDLGIGLPAWSRVATLRWLRGDVEGSFSGWAEAVTAGYGSDAEPIAECLVQNGHVHWHKGQLNLAYARYQQALNLEAAYAPALLGRGRVQFARGNFAAALADLQASIAARPSAEAFSWLADTQRAMGRSEEARATEDRLEQHARGSDPRALSLYYATRKRNAEDAVDLARRDAEQRGDIYSHDALSFALLRAGRLDDAAPHAEAALAHGTRDALLLAHAGLLDAARGQHPRARQRLEGALALNPSFDPVLPAEVKQVLASLPPRRSRKR